MEPWTAESFLIDELPIDTPFIGEDPIEIKGVSQETGSNSRPVQKEHLVNSTEL